MVAKNHMLRVFAWKVAAIALLPILSASALAPVVVAQSAPPTITITGDIPGPVSLTAADLAALPRATVSTESNGITTQYSGVWMADVLRKARAPMGSGMRGSSLSAYVIATATDGYQVVFSLGELDPDLAGGQYLVADSANGKPLFGENGAFRLVVPMDKRGARSVRMLSSVKVVQLNK